MRPAASSGWPRLRPIHVQDSASQPGERRLAARCGLRGSALRATGMVAGRRRYPRSPAHARGRPLRAATVAASTPGVPCPRQGNREWGLRPRAPPPPCRHPRWPALTKASVVVGQVVRVCDRRPHSRSPRRWQAGAGVDEECEASLGGRPRAWAGERIPGPPARAPNEAVTRECRSRAANSPSDQVRSLSIKKKTCQIPASAARAASPRIAPEAASVLRKSRVQRRGDLLVIVMRRG